jgi:hypothetical protein
MNIIIDSQEKFIREHIVSEFKNDPEKDPETYSNIITWYVVRSNLFVIRQ